jgi:hypothetical protein
MPKKVGNAIGYIGGTLLVVATITSAVYYGVKKIIRR